MPVKIGFTIVSSTGEDERYRATELNYHGPTVRGWRSALDCTYPQEIVMQLNVTALLHRIQILSHQYLISQKIELWTSEGLEYDPSLSPTAGQSFQYLGFITLSDNRSTGFKSRELKSITVPPTTAKYIKLRLHSNHTNERNVYNQVGLVAVNVLGDEVPELDMDGDDVNNNGGVYQTRTQQNEGFNLISNPQYVSPYDDLAFEMYVDKDVARIMRIMEAKKHQAVLEERFEYASKLKAALEDLRGAGETLGKYEQEKRQAINTEDYDKAKLKKLQIDQYREQVYTVLQIDQLLELEGPLRDNDSNSNNFVNRSLRKQELTPPFLDGPDAERFGRGETPSPNPDSKDQADDQGAASDWDRLHPRPQPLYHSNRPETPSQLSHSQSQTSFDRYVDHRDPPGSPRYSNSISSLHPSLVQFPVHQPHMFSAPTFRSATSLYNCHTWLSSTSTRDPSGMYYSMPTQKTVDEGPRPAVSEQVTDFYPPQRNYSDGEIKCEVGEGAARVEARPSVQDKEREKKVEVVETVTGSGAKNTTSSSSTTQPLHRPTSLRGSLRRRNKSTGAIAADNSYEAYEERMLPALRHYHGNEIVRECQLGLVDPTRKSKLNEREKKQAALPISVFGIELVEKFYSKHFADKEDGLKQLRDDLKRRVTSEEEQPDGVRHHTPNKIARATIFLLHRALRDKVYSVYSSAADAIRFFFSDYVPNRVSSAEIARSVERLLPELIAKSGDSTPRIHNMAAHTLLSMADCKEVRELHIIPVHLSRPLTSSVHPRLALSRLEMIEQLILNHGISTEKQSGLTCRTLAEFGSSGLHHPAEAVRKVSERILIQVYRVNPRIVRKQLPPDDDITRRNLLYRQLFQEFDFMDLQRKRELNEKSTRSASLGPTAESIQKRVTQSEPRGRQDTGTDADDAGSDKQRKDRNWTGPKRTVNRQTSPVQPCVSPPQCNSSKDAKTSDSLGRNSVKRQEVPSGNVREQNNNNNTKILPPSKEKAKTDEVNEQNDRRKGMSCIAEEKSESDAKPGQGTGDGESGAGDEEDVPLAFPNLVDSVRVTDERLSFARKGMRNLKSLKYIFPTTYIGNSTASRVDPSNGVAKPGKKSEPEGKTQNGGHHSGIPVPTGGRQNGYQYQTDKGVRHAKGDDSKRVERSNGGDENGKAGKNGHKSRDDEVEPFAESSSSTKNKWNSQGDDGANITRSSPSDHSSASRNSKEPKQTFKMCIFCFASDNWFTEESLNNHYWKSCPMLTRCVYCKEVVEISGLIQHRLDDCEHKHIFEKCNSCQEAVPKELINDHDCVVSATGDPKLRCPLCHSDIEKEEDWREHLMGAKVCPNHPRRYTRPEDGAFALNGTTNE